MNLARLNPRVLVTRHFQSLLSLAIRGLSVFVGFAVTLLIGRMFGPEANGHYALITQTGMFLSVVAVGGIDLAVTRTFSAATARRVPIERRSLLRITGYSMGFAALLMGLLLLAGEPLIRLMFNGEVPEGAILVLIIVMISRALTRLLGAILRSQKDYAWGQSVEVLLIPTLVLTAMALGFRRDVEQILWITAFAGLSVGVGAFLASLRHTSNDPEALHIPMKDTLKIAVPLWGVAVFLNISDWYGLATTSAVLGVHEAGLYRVAAQVATALSIITLGLSSVFSPQFGAAASTGDLAKVARLAGTATRLSVVLALPVVILIFVFARPIVLLFGPEFAPAETILRIAAVGQAAFTVAGPSWLVLAMTGHQRTNLTITLCSTVALLVLAPLSAHFGGLMGISAVMALVLVARNIASLVAAARLTGIHVMRGRYRPPSADAGVSTPTPPF